MSRKGFTLIELLVVVAVLALLASIVFSNLGGAREGARISNALSFQSQTHSLLGSDLVGWWNFNEGSGTTAGDISGYDNHGNIIGATYVDGVPGTGGTALSFNGSSDYVSIPSNTLLKNSVKNSFTISAWVNSNATGDQYGIFTISGSYTNGWTVYLRQGPQFSFIGFIDGSSTGTKTTPAGEIKSNEWYNIIYSFDGSRIRGYVNGELKHNSTLEGEFDINPTNNTLTGRDPSIASPGYWNGLIDDVRIYSRALTAQEIQALYAQTNGKYSANE